MQVTFETLSISSVMPSYSWDEGNPLSSSGDSQTVPLTCLYNINEDRCRNPQRNNLQLGWFALKQDTPPSWCEETPIKNWSITKSGEERETLWQELDSIDAERWNDFQCCSGVRIKWNNSKEGEEYQFRWNEVPIFVGYAPFVTLQLSSSVTNSNKFQLAAIRKIDFGDYYNSVENNVNIIGNGNAVISHNYIMPGLYQVSFTEEEYITVNNFKRYKCLEDYCTNWTWGTHAIETNSPFLKNPLIGCSEVAWKNWSSTKYGLPFTKTWNFTFDGECWDWSQMECCSNAPLSSIDCCTNPVLTAITWYDTKLGNNYERTW